ncbi:ABC transporter substrate-binding protein [Brachyspira pilosicoli]|uniref:ABC transporter substrate-binding protein n=1 Tax=Brachyspira pilosicoli TaxID=52584 RepID=A0A5C8ESN4_BRAPL|nr:ABC transporter substrate-binding protein [Brachyspira pilosicoli]TXJ41049.1 ABC transporter substrate-binding protein [Brachyspira pilosicoli]
MKKIFIIFLISFNLYAFEMCLLNGPSAIGAVKMINDYKKININIINSPNNILASIIKGEADIAAVPANMASIIYNRGLDYKIVAVVSETKMFIVSSDKNIKSIDDLKNKTIYCGLKLSTPDLMLQYLIKTQNIKGASINYSLGNLDLSKALASKNVDIAILPEPFLSSALLENKDINIVVDISKYTPPYPVAVLIAKKSFIENNNALLKEILDEYKKSTEYILNNKDKIEPLIKQTSILINAKAVVYGIDRIGITFYNDNNMKLKLNDYYNFIYNFDKNLIGNKIPKDDFYYIF